MRKNKKVALFGSLKVMTMSAMFCAMSVVIGIFCKSFLNFGLGLFRITFENLPILMSGIMFGPIVGGLVGGATDIVTYFLSGQVYPLNPIVTLGAVSIGLISGFLSRYIFRKHGYARIIIPSAAAHIVGSMIIKTIGLYSIYGIAVIWRVPTYIAISMLEITALCLMYKNLYIKRLMDNSSGRKGKSRALEEGK